MVRQQITKKLKILVEVEVLKGNDHDVDANPLLELGVLDSFSLLQLLYFIESEFGVDISLETFTLDRLKDLNSIADLIIELRRRS